MILYKSFDFDAWEMCRLPAEGFREASRHSSGRLGIGVSVASGFDVDASEMCRLPAEGFREASWRSRG